jgi:hypothetical protein
MALTERRDEVIDMKTNIRVTNTTHELAGPTPDAARLAVVSLSTPGVHTGDK